MKEEKKFEEVMQDLENIASELEKGELDLDQSVAKFEEGMKASKHCTEILDKAEKKIVTVLEKNSEIVEEELK